MAPEERRELRERALTNAVWLHDEDTSTPYELKIQEVLTTAQTFYDWICEGTVRPPRRR